MIKLGVSGESGSFSEEAGILYAQRAGIQCSLDFLVDMEGVLAAVAARRVDLGIFPVVNSIGGLVTMAFTAMGKYLFYWEDQLSLNINQCLLAVTGVDLSHIRTVVSHPQGLAQCRLYLEKQLPQAEQRVWQDTAKAARELAEGQLNFDCAVIASKRAAQIYGLQVLEENIQDAHPNITTFIIVKP